MQGKFNGFKSNFMIQTGSSSVYWLMPRKYFFYQIFQVATDPRHQPTSEFRRNLSAADRYKAPRTINASMKEKTMIAAASEKKQCSGVIWITGFSSSGKTTVGRKVEYLLREIGINTIFLDGDDLRSIFAARWGYEREERVELARVYFRLCSHLAAQGYTVVIAAVAMYSEVREWLRENVPGVLEVYLDVPDKERKHHDQETKQIYEKVGDVAKMYDLPDDKVLRIENFGARSSEQTAQEITTHYLRLAKNEVDFGRTDYWSKYYSSGSAPAKPSPFAEFVNATLKPGAKLLEVGCGNGRDSSYFSREGHIYFDHAKIRKSLGEMTRKLSDTASQ